MNLIKMSTFKPFKKSNISSNDVRENLIKQDFSPNSPNKVWASDITYLKVNGKHAYLLVVLDLFSRKVVGWKLDFNIKSELVCSILKSAYIRRVSPNNLIFHSDQ